MRVSRVALIDDHPLFRTGVRGLIDAESDLEVVAELDSARQALQAAAEMDLDLFVVDIKLPDRDGIALVSELHRLKRRCLMLSMYDDTDHAARSMAAGASGYALKRDPPERILEAIRAVCDGDTWLTPSLASSEPDPQHAGLASLSRREREVFDLVVRGVPGREIAKTLSISAKTVESHRYKINRKLGVRSVAQLVRFAALNGIPMS